MKEPTVFSNIGNLKLLFVTDNLLHIIAQMDTFPKTHSCRQNPIGCRLLMNRVNKKSSNWK